MCPVFVGAGQIHPSAGEPCAFHRLSSTARARGVIGMMRLAAFVLPLVTRMVPFRPLAHVICSQRMRCSSSGLMPVSNNSVATSVGVEKVTVIGGGMAGKRGK
jgi:hypothetical protein